MGHPSPLKDSEFGQNPIEQFAIWFEDARASSGLLNPNAFSLATIDLQGNPDARMLLLKDFSELGFSFYTNQESVKGQSLQKTPRAAMTFFWDPLYRQVRIQGETILLSESEADVYFRTRHRLSQLGAWASQQSRELNNRESLEEKVAELEKRFAGLEIPRPAYWRGFILKPWKIEFWQEQPGRLHDRFQFRKDSTGTWQRSRLSP